MSERVRVSSSEVGETERLRGRERVSSDSQSRVCVREYKKDAGTRLMRYALTLPTTSIRYTYSTTTVTCTSLLLLH